jgi:hypothetical protein
MSLESYVEIQLGPSMEETIELTIGHKGMSGLWTVVWSQFMF